MTEEHTTSDIDTIRDSLADVAVGIKELAKAVADDTKRKRQMTNRLLSLLLVAVVALGAFNVYRAQQADQNAEQLKEFVEQVQHNTQIDIQAAIDHYVEQGRTDPQRVTKQDVIDVVCDLDPTLCDSDGNYIGR